jgi:hypothetical protein
VATGGPPVLITDRLAADRLLVMASAGESGDGEPD